MDTQETVSVVVRFAMACRRESQQQLGAALGLSQPALSHRLRGRTRWSVDDLDALATHYGLAVAELVSPPSPLPAVLDTPPHMRGTVPRMPRRRGGHLLVAAGPQVTRKYLPDTPRRSLDTARPAVARADVDPLASIAA